MAEISLNVVGNKYSSISSAQWSMDKSGKDAIAWYKFDDNYDDSSGNNNTLTNYSCRFNSTDFKTYNGSIEFTGSSYLQVANDGRFSPDSFTITGWGKLPPDSDTVMCASCRSGTVQNGYGWMIAIDSDRHTKIRISTRNVLSVANVFCYSTTDFCSSPAKWNHFAFSYSSILKKVVIYINGVLDITYYNIEYSANTTTNLRIGAGNNEGNPSFYLQNGSLLDDFRIYNRVLSQDEVSILYNNGNGINTPLENANISYNKVKLYSNEIQVPRNMYYVNYMFENSQKLLTDNSDNNRSLTTLGNYELNDGKNSLLLTNQDATLPTANWSTFNDLTISGWFKTSELVNDEKLLEFSYTDIIFPFTSSPNVTPVAIGGATDDYYVAFTSTSSAYTVTFTRETVCDILVVGGGGGGGQGGYENGGGGGGGIVYMVNKLFVSGITYKVIVGDGGAAATVGKNSSITLLNDTPISIDNISVVGKGGGGGGSGSGGSGGGGNNRQGNKTAGTSIQGNTYWNGTTYIAGGFNGQNGSDYTGGGGGGAGEVGGTDGFLEGGDGRQVSITGTNVFYGGGGAGGGSGKTSGGDGGGGGAGPWGANGENGTANTGGGGGGAYNSNAYNGGNGGSGIVIIRYSTNQEKNILIKKINNTDLSFQINNTPIYTSPSWTNNVWTYILWNITNSTLQQGFVKINNGAKQTYTKIPLSNSTYINKLCPVNANNVYISDFKIVTVPLTTEIENHLYDPATNKLINTYNSIVDNTYVKNSLLNLTKLHAGGYKKLETISSGISITGNLLASGTIVQNSSDMRLKTVSGDIINPVSKIMNISAFKYTPSALAKQLYQADDTIQIGVSAQEVQQVLPEVVSENQEGFLTISYSRMVPLLVEAIKQLKIELDELSRDC